MQPSRSRRAVVGSTAGDDLARLQARALLLSGWEVVFIGGHQSVEQLASTARAEDAGAVIVDGGDDVLQAVRAHLHGWGLSQVEVKGCDQPDAPRGAVGG